MDIVRGAVINEFRRNPGKFLAYCVVSRSLEEAGGKDLPHRSILVLIAAESWLQRYEWAMELFFSDFPSAASHVASADKVWSVSGRSSAKSKTGIDVLGSFRRLAVLAPSLDLVPDNVRLAATKVVHLGKPTPAQIRAARRLAGLPELSADIVEELARAEPDAIEAFVARRTVEWRELKEAISKTRLNGNVPKLSELPGLSADPEWVEQIKFDLPAWRDGRIQWAELQSRAILHGPPGTGKTLFVSALAAELGIPLVTTSPDKWQQSGEGYLGDMLLAMRAAFTSVLAHGCCILFIDEIDGIGRRGQGSGRNAYYESMVVNAFMGLVDEIADKGGVILLGATNRLEDIDAAILRSGRLEHRITIEPPDLETRARILQHHLSGAVDLQRLKKLIDDLPDKTASDLELLARKANGTARREGRQVSLDDVKRHLPERILLSEADLMRIAVHEIGHALVAMSTKMVGDVSVEIRGDYFAGTGQAQDGGRTHYEINGTMLPTDAHFLARIRICLGGMAAEEVMYPNRSIGGAGSSGSDLAEATKYATQMVRSFGMGKGLAFEQDWRAIDNGQALPPELRAEVSAIITKEYKVAKELLAKEKATILRHAAELVVDRRREYRRT